MSKKKKIEKSRKNAERNTRSSKDWKAKYKELRAETDIKLEPDEKIKQCKKPYPAYWWITNRGRLFSIWNNRIEQLKPEVNYCGKKRDHLVWRYNYKGNRHVPVDKLVFDHFGKSEWDDYDGNLDLHHIFGMKHWNEDDCFEASRIENIQAIPREKVHPFATELDNKTELEVFLKFLKKTDGDVLETNLGTMLLNGSFPQGATLYMQVQDEEGRTGYRVARASETELKAMIKMSAVD